MASKITLIGMAYQMAWSDMADLAGGQAQVFMGSPGNVLERDCRGHQYVFHQYTSAAGNRVQNQLGRADDPQTQVARETLRERIAQTKALVESIRDLVKLGYQVADFKTYGVAAALYNAGLFQHGLTLIGSHAYGVLLNTLGISATPYRSNDVDVARGPGKLVLPSLDLAQLLAQTQIDFVPVPAFNHQDPSTSHKERGKSPFRVDLLVPSKTMKIGTVAVPVLKSFATALPYLGYLLENTSMATLISRHGAVPVRVPEAARFAVHKLVVADLRVNQRDKTAKDIHQAAVLLAALVQRQPGDIEAAVAALPNAARPHGVRRMQALRTELAGETLEAVLQALEGLA